MSSSLWDDEVEDDPELQAAAEKEAAIWAGVELPPEPEPEPANDAPGDAVGVAAGGEQSADDGAYVAERLAAMARLFGVRRTSTGLLFVQPENATESISITGDFNDWSPQGVAMTRDRRLGIWQTTVQLKPGRYHYRLIVDGQSVPDPYNKQVRQRDDGHVSNYADVA